MRFGSGFYADTEPKPSKNQSESRGNAAHSLGRYRSSLFASALGIDDQAGDFLEGLVAAARRWSAGPSTVLNLHAFSLPGATQL